MFHRAAVLIHVHCPYCAHDPSLNFAGVCQVLRVLLSLLCFHLCQTNTLLIVLLTACACILEGLLF